MSENLSFQGVVLSSSPIGENDKRVVILTVEKGKISAFAKGARKGKSAITLATNPLVFGTFNAFKGKNSYTITSADVIKYFDFLTKDYDKLCLASYFLEVSDFFSTENTDEKERLNLLYLSLSMLSREDCNRILIKRIYELRTFKINGEYPNVFSCLNCGKNENLGFYSEEKNGIICVDCEKKIKEGYEIDKDLIYVLKYVITSPLKKLFSFKLKENLLNKFDYFMDRYIDKNLCHRFRSEKFLN